jgi:hypothetical protein
MTMSSVPSITNDLKSSPVNGSCVAATVEGFAALGGACAVTAAAWGSVNGRAEGGGFFAAAATTTGMVVVDEVEVGVFGVDVVVVVGGVDVDVVVVEGVVVDVVVVEGVVVDVVEVEVVVGGVDVDVVVVVGGGVQLEMEWTKPPRRTHWPGPMRASIWMTPQKFG